MVPESNIRVAAYAAAACAALATANLIRLLYVAVAEGRALTTVEDVFLDLSMGVLVLALLGWLALRHQSRGSELYQRRINEEARKLDTAISHMSQGLVMFDPSHRLVLCNLRYLELYGASPDVVKPGLSFRDLLIHRKEVGSFFGDVDETCNRIEASLADGKIRTFVRHGRDGRLIRIVSEPLKDGGWVATHEDVTERQQLLEAGERAEADAREKKAQLRAALNNMTQGLCMYDADGRVVLFNRQYCELMGDSENDMQGRSLLDVLRRRKAAGAFVGDPDTLFSDIIESVRLGEIRAIETTGPGGIILRVVQHPIESGGWVATFENVTAQRRAEHQRDQNRAFLDLIINYVPSAIFVKRAADRKYVLVNEAIERFWGQSRDTVIGRTAREIFSKAEAAKIETRDDELLQSGGPIFDEREILTPNGSLHNIFARRIAFFDERDHTQYILGVVDDVTERKAAEARIARLAHYDSLTELPNRTLFREQLERELLFVRRGAKLAILCIDLDRFKGVNDTLGHPAGDQLLKEVAQRLRACLAEGDLIARLGGDEFAIVRTGLQEPKEAEALAQRLREAVASSIFGLNGHQTTTDLSIGIALAPEDGVEIDELLNHADLALYGAKAEGRANYRYYEPQMNARMKRRRELELDLRSALGSKEFALHYQPVVNLHTGAITGCEALLRWTHPRRGVIQPLEFIPVAEETGLVSSIGEWVLRQACADAMDWPNHVSVAVNVSSFQFRSPSLPLMVAASLAEAGLVPGRLELEITESLLLQNSETTIVALHQIRDLGVRISMDDFGTGYSALCYLRNFPFDKIKIDRSFINDLSKSDEAAAIVLAIITLANTLKMTTTAEGVETIDQQKFLKEAGCSEMQGYLFSPPVPAHEIKRLLTLRQLPNKVAS